MYFYIVVVWVVTQVDTNVSEEYAASFFGVEVNGMRIRLYRRAAMKAVTQIRKRRKIHNPVRANANGEQEM
jgi:hypothetical protein